MRAHRWMLWDIDGCIAFLLGKGGPRCDGSTVMGSIRTAFLEMI